MKRIFFLLFLLSSTFAVEKLNGIVKQFYDNGNLHVKGEWKNGKKIGLWISYYENGIKEEEITFVSGKTNGYHIVYDENGRVSSKELMKNDVLISGESFDHYDSGKVSKKLTYKGQTEEGELQEMFMTLYDEKGKIVGKGGYSNSEKNGDWVEYPEDGTTMKGSYVHDLKDGDWKSYDKKGLIIEKIPFLNGVPEGIGEMYDEKGNVLYQVTYRDGKEGEITPVKGKIEPTEDSDEK